MYLVSVIVPVYNAGRYLDRCLTELERMGPETQLILVDDGSADDSLAILRNFQKDKPNVAVIAKENGGPSDARNAGLAVAEGKYIIFCDADDMLDHRVIDDLKRLDGNNYDLIQFGVVSHCGEQEETAELFRPTSGELSPEEMLDLIALIVGYRDERKLLFGYFGLVTCKIFRREAIKGVRFDTAVVGEDTLFDAEAVKNCRSIYFLAESYYHYYTIENSYSHRLYPGIEVKAARMLNEISRCMEGYMGCPEIARGFEYRCYDFFKWSMVAGIDWTHVSRREAVEFMKKLAGNEKFRIGIEKMNTDLLSLRDRREFTLVRRGRYGTIYGFKRLTHIKQRAKQRLKQLLRH